MGMVLKAGNWRPSLAAWLILLMPLLLSLPVLAGHVSIDPMVYVASVGDTIHFRGGYPWIDPNVGFHAQALGKLSADMLLHGQMPWWNPYNGVGLPLAAEVQPASFFLPFILLLHFQSGVVWLQIIMQIMAGLCTYALLRKLRMTEWAAATGGLLYELNGTFAWMGLTVTGPIAFLPMLLLGTEQLLQRVNDRRPGGWALIPLALAWSIYSGFPEVAYIDGLFVALWVLCRLPDVEPGCRVEYLRKLAVAVVVGLACSFLQLLPFAHYVAHASVGGHQGWLSQFGLPPAAVALTLVPGLFGPIFGFDDPSHTINLVWSNIGGYVPALQWLVLLMAVQLRPRRIILAPCIWIVLCLGRTFGIHPIIDLMNALPMLNMAATYRYAPPSWEFASVLLVSVGMDALQRGTISVRRQAIIAIIVTTACILAAIWLAWPVISALRADAVHAHYVSASMAWLMVTLSAASVVLLMVRRWTWAPYALAILLVMDAAMAFAAPMHSGTRYVQSERGGLDYLRDHIGLQRVYSLGPLAPNYGAYFRIAQINHNYMPLSSDWAEYVTQRLDPAVQETVFTGNNNRAPGFGSAAAQLQMRLPAYEEVGVKYVLAPHGVVPLAKTIEMPGDPNQYHAALQLGNDRSAVLHWRIPAQSYARGLRAVSVQLGNYNGRSDGQLTVKVCVDGDDCVRGHRSLSESLDNSTFVVPLDRDLSIPPTTQASVVPITITFAEAQESFPVALWISGVEIAEAANVNLEGSPSGTAPTVSLLYTTSVAGDSKVSPYSLVYDGADMSIYELAGTKPYFEVIKGNCTVQAVARQSVKAHCSGSAEMLRREAFFQGWSARVNGREVPVERAHDIFQAIALPTGDSDVEFTYRPPYYRAMLVVFWFGIFALLRAAFQELRRARNALPTPA